MKHYFFILMLIVCLGMSTKAQKPEQKSNLPKEDIKVNREYDEKGNLIKFDSIYSYSWSGDTTLMKSFAPKDFPDMFGDSFNFFNDSAFLGDSFFDNLDQLFASPFCSKNDSLLMQRFGKTHHFEILKHQGDTIVINDKDFKDFFNPFINKKDSLQSNSPDKTVPKSHPKSMDEILEMLQQQMIEMEKRQQQFFKETPKEF